MSTSSLIQALPEAWRSTNGLAILGSIGIHVILLAVLPFAELNPQDIDLQSSVGVVTLTPEEQSRVPQVAAVPSVITPPSPTQEQPSSSQGFQSEILPPLPAPSPFLPPPPGTTPMYQMPNNLPAPTPIPLPPPPQSLPAPNSLEQLPAPQQNPNQKIQMRQITPAAPSLPSTTGLQPSLPPAPIQPPISKMPDRTQPESIARRNALVQKLAANQNRTATPTQNDRAARERLLDAASQQQLQRAKEREERAARWSAALQQQSNPKAAANNSDDRAERLSAVLQRKQRQTEPSATLKSRAARLAALQQRLARPIGTRPEATQTESAQTIAQIAALQQQYQKVQQLYPQFAIATPIRRKIPVCNRQLNGGEAIIAALIDPTGKIVVGPDVISQDSPISVQRAAIAYVKRFPFTKSATPINQTFRLEFTYNSDLCPSK